MEALFQHLVSLASDASAAAASALFSAIWQGAVLAAVVALALRLMPGLSAAARSLIWMNVFALLVLLHIVPAVFGQWGNQNPLHSPAIHLDLRWSIAIAGTWAALSLWKGIELVVSAVRLRGIARRAAPVPLHPALGPNLEALLQSTAAGIKPGRAALLCTSMEVERPCVLGFSRARILLPPGLLQQLSTLELQLVLEHEMEHLRRADDWSNLLQKIGLVLFPLNPVLLWVEHRLCAERELACDDRVLRSNVVPKAYAICLTHLAEYSMLYRRLSLVLGAWERQSELVRRVHRILSRPSRSMTGKPAAAAISVLMAGALACALSLARTPQLVSFAPPLNSSLQARFAPSSDLRSMSPAELGGTPQLVKAVLPSRPVMAQNAPKHVHIAALKHPAKPEFDQVPPAMLVLTEWQSTEWQSTDGQATFAPPQLVIAVDRKTRTSYAAVRVPNGWIFVQI